MCKFLSHCQLWTEILKSYPKPTFTRKSIYQLWSRLSSQSWKRDEDEIQSAQILLEEFQEPSADRPYTVEPIPVEQGEGITVIAFALPENLRQWGGRLRELQLDSTCELLNTTFPLVNKSLITYLNGQGIQMVPGLKFLRSLVKFMDRGCHLGIS